MIFHESTCEQYFSSGCLNQLTGQSGIFISDNFPDDYATDTDCTWNITVAEDKRVKLTFHLFNVRFLSFIVYFVLKLLSY